MPNLEQAKPGVPRLHPARRILPSALMTLLIATAVWSVFCRPLPRHLASGITMSSRNVEKGNARTMIRGDHLQLLYHFWLFGDMLRGHSPYEMNIYEFNTGDDNARWEPNTYFYPFCFAYVLGEWAGGRAFGWNLTVFLALWLTYFLTVRLLLRFTAGAGWAYTAGLVSLLLPYRWLTLLGGSPTGFCMVWIPLLMLGAHAAVQNRSIWGGIGAGFAIWMTFLGDHHVFFFAALFLIPWMAFSWLMHPAKVERSWKSLGRTLISLSIPFLVLAATAVFLQGDAEGRFGQSHISGGRTLLEVLAFSPAMEGLVNTAASALSTQVFIGWSLIAILLLGFLAAFYLRHFQEGRRLWLGLALLLLGSMFIVLLGVGMRGPFEGLLYRICRHTIPNYMMIRQPGKIFCLMPFILAVAATLAFSALRMAVPKKWIMAPILLMVAGMAIESRLQVSPTICLLRPDQPAYAAIAEDARSEGRNPHALILPLWPGDSHESSSYEYYVSLYRIRMVNGYNPVVQHEYFDNVFRRFESANQGELTQEQIAGLKELGVRYILLHEDQFPDKTSPYPVAFTRERLLTHPHLKLLRQADRVWAFKITDESQPIAMTSDYCSSYFPSRLTEAENLVSNAIPILGDLAASHRGFARLAAADAQLHTRPLLTTTATHQRWMLRLRGAGEIQVRQTVAGTVSDDTSVSVRTNVWTWYEVPVKGLHKFSSLQLSLAPATGSVDVDVLLLTAGTWEAPAPGETLTLSAPCFFRAGYTDLKQSAVVFRADTEPQGAIFYGPFLPVEPGDYELEFIFESTAPAGVDLGHFRAGHQDGPAHSAIPIISGQPARLALSVRNNLPLALAFDFSRNGDIDIKSILIKRSTD